MRWAYTNGVLGLHQRIPTLSHLKNAENSRFPLGMRAARCRLGGLRWVMAEAATRTPVPLVLAVCPTLEDDWEATLDSLFCSLPEEYIGAKLLEEKPSEVVQILPGLLLGYMTLTGLNKLEPDRPYQTFCKGGQRIILFSVTATSPLRLSIPWVSCAGTNGTVGSVAKLVRLEGQIKVDKALEPRPVWWMSNLTPVVLEELSVELGGPGGGGRVVAAVMDHLLAGSVRKFWVYSTGFIRNAIVDMAKRGNVTFDGIPTH
ncbi:hypothetical protein HPB47_015711 [Ixodes persulcatus]|uniref:Uncharacterized protein n=1 Tax=Ixodes persulcatus TaxID=34615 RepID=A0AC60QWC0_IXOPE|nr:hypothetical protein HPB47_015711 [Ixodes persulcatus]